MSNLKKSNTISNLKRSNTIQTLKRAGTEAWKWINAEDVKVSENRPVGYSYFQKSNTFKNPYSNENNPDQMKHRLINNQDNEYFTNNNPMSPYPLNTYQANNSLDINIESPYTISSPYVSNKNSNSPVTNIKKPEATAKKGKEKSKNAKVQRVPTVLSNPIVRKQLENLKQYTPYFMYTATFLQILLLIISLIVNYEYENKIISPFSINYTIGPSTNTLIRLGGRFVPCMKSVDESVNRKLFNITEGVHRLKCPKGFKSSTTSLNEKSKDVCNLKDYLSYYCGMGGFEENEEPNQWYRFIIPIFLHTGIIHLIFNLFFQIRTGVQMERDFGTWRMSIIYMLSGIFGFAFGANLAVGTPSVGCSGSLYGLLACLLLDLIQNWKLIIKPWRELAKMVILIVISLGIGLFPYLDNFAHVGGFYIGILTGFIFMPTIIFSKSDLRRKRILMVISIILLIISFIWVFKQFYGVTSKCTWCKYFNCLPIFGWCEKVY